MLTSSLFFSFFLLFSCAPSTTSGRRSLHQPPFFPQNSLPPSDPPSLSPPSPKPKFPFSTSTPKASPFFPTYPSPPPPSPITFASFPANLSSLVLPHRHSSKYPSKLLAAAAVSTAAVVAALALFCYFRRKRAPELADGKGLGGAKQKERLSSTNSEFLYIETLVSSRRVDEGNVGAVSKLDSPELRPLPPLSRQSNRSCRQNCGNGYVSSTADEDEEFYSPRGSLGGGFESSRSYDVVGAENFESRISHSSSYSSSTSGSSARSHSISISPPVSLSPRKSQPKSPKPVTVHSSSSSERDESPPRKSDVPGMYLRSPTLSPEILSAPPNPEASLRLWNAPGRSVHSPVLSMTSSSPELNAYATNTLSPATTLSPERGFDMNPDASWAQNVRSPARSVDLNLTEASSPEMSPVMVQIQNVESLESVANASYKPISAPAPPRPPPLPPQKSKPIAQLSSKPPPLAPPSRPFVFQNRTKVSPEKMEESPKPKLKPLHWDKVRASSGRDMVWDHLGSSSFKLNEEMIESLFIVNTPQSKPKETKTTHCAVLHSPDQDNRVLDPKRSQNIAISLRALNVAVDEVCEALLEGNAETLGTELLESLTKMAPTKEEERKLRDFKEDSPVKLGPAEKFLKAVLDVPFAFKRVESMLYMTNFQTEVEYLNKSFQTLEVACEELRKSRMFLKLLEAVLKTGNRMNVGTNRGDAHAFKLDTLLKLIDVKGADGKTTLLHFVVQEIIRTEGARLSSSEDVAKCRNLGLQIVSGLSSELVNVKKVASMDSEVLSSDVSKLSRGIRNLEEVLSLSETTDIGERTQRFSDSMNEFKKMAEKEIIKLQARESVALSLVKEVTEYFHGNLAREEAHPLRIFMVVRDFLSVLDRVCKEVGVINERVRVSSVHKCPIPINPIIPQVVPVFPERKLDCSSDDESSSECSF